MPTWVNLSQGGSTLHSPEATEKKASTTSAGVRAKDPKPVVSGRRAKNLADILSSYKKTKKPKKRRRAKPAAKQPPKKRQSCCRVRVRRVRISKRLKKMKRRSRLPEMRRRSCLLEMMTMNTRLRRHRFQTEGHCRGHGLPSNKRTSGERGEECRFRSGAPGKRRYPDTSCSRRPNWAVPVQSIRSLQTTNLPCGIPWGSIVLRPEATQRRRSAKTRRQWSRQPVACQLQVPGRRNSRQRGQRRRGSRQRRVVASKKKKMPERETKRIRKRKTRLQYKCQAVSSEPGLRKLHWIGTLLVVRFRCCLYVHL